jgi:hypothetical protein
MDVSSKGLETRGYRPRLDQRGAIAKFLHIECERMLRTEISIRIIHGNSWSGWLENGNPHGKHRPGPISQPWGIIF